MYKTYKVSEQNKKDGRRYNCNLCPVALAILGQHTNFNKVNAGHTHITAELIDGTRLTAKTPDHISVFMADFDCECIHINSPEFTLNWK